VKIKVTLRETESVTGAPCTRVSTHYVWKNWWHDTSVVFPCRINTSD